MTLTRWVCWAITGAARRITSPDRPGGPHHGHVQQVVRFAGGFIAGDDVVMHYVQHHARSLCSALNYGSQHRRGAGRVDIMESEPERIQKLWHNTEKMRVGFKALGFDTGASVTPVIRSILAKI